MYLGGIPDFLPANYVHKQIFAKCEDSVKRCLDGKGVILASVVRLGASLGAEGLDGVDGGGAARW